MSTNKWAVLAAFCGYSIFGFSFLFSRYALDVASPTVLVAVRFTVAFLVLNLIVLVGRILKRKDGSPLVPFSLKGKPIRDMILLTLCQPIGYFICESYGIVFTSTSFSGIIIATAPFAGMLWDILLLHEKVSKRSALCVALSVAGVLITTIGAGDLKASLVGLVLLLGAVAVGTLFHYFAKKAAPYYNALERTYCMFGGGAVFYVIVILVQYRSRVGEMVGPALASGTFRISILYLAVLSSVVAFWLMNFSNQYLSITGMNLFANFTTVISIAAGVLILREPFSPMQILGSVIILLSVYLFKPGQTS